jgi:hypothetical protein
LANGREAPGLPSGRAAEIVSQPQGSLGCGSVGRGWGCRARRPIPMGGMVWWLLAVACFQRHLVIGCSSSRLRGWLVITLAGVQNGPAGKRCGRDASNSRAAAVWRAAVGYAEPGAHASGKLERGCQQVIGAQPESQPRPAAVWRNMLMPGSSAVCYSTKFWCSQYGAYRRGFRQWAGPDAGSGNSRCRLSLRVRPGWGYQLSGSLSLAAGLGAGGDIGPMRPPKSGTITQSWSRSKGRTNMVGNVA